MTMNLELDTRLTWLMTVIESFQVIQPRLQYYVQQMALLPQNKMGDKR